MPDRPIDRGNVQALVAALQDALGLRVECGTLSLNINEALLQSWKVETHGRLTRDSGKAKLDTQVESRP